MSLRTAFMRWLVTRLSVKKTSTSDNLNLTQALSQVDAIFGRERSLRLSDPGAIVSYFTQSEWAYNMYHSEADCIHLAINEDGIFHPDGYYAHPRYVAKQIEKIKAQAVLEVGCGKGFNSRFLAEQFPSVNFVGLDLTPLHIEIARHKAQQIKNLSFQAGDFNALPSLSNSVDIIFAVETLCYAKDPSLLFKEMHRVLRPGGQLIVFDAFSNAAPSTWPADVRAAVKLTEVSMVVEHGFSPMAEWLEAARLAGFQVALHRDLTPAVRPGLLRLQSLSQRFFRVRFRARLLQWLSPQYLVRNAIAGLLMPFVFLPHESPISYFQIALTKAGIFDDSKI